MAPIRLGRVRAERAVRPNPSTPGSGAPTSDSLLRKECETMKTTRVGIHWAGILLVLLTGGTVQARVSRVEVKSRADVAGGKAFGLAGPYERVVGKAYFELDP